MRCSVAAVATRRCAVAGIGAIIVILAACAAGPQYVYNVDPSANLARYRTFAFFDERTNKMVPYQSVAHRHLKAAISREMRARGYQPSDKPDLLVNIHLQRRHDDSGQPIALSPDYYAYRNGLYAWREGVKSGATHYADGTLNVDVVDPASNQLLWEGVAVGSVSQRMYENLEATIDNVTAKLFERFPQRSQS